MTRRIGIYSGTFDPIHNGHITFALAALETGGLDEVVFLPEARPRAKSTVTDIRHRTAMATNALAKYDRLSVTTLQSAQFTITDTLPELQRLFPDAELSFLIGSDIVGGLSQWNNLEQLAGMQFIIGMRRDDTPETINDLVMPALAPHGIATVFITDRSDATAHATSSAVRGGDTSHLPAELRQYIHLNNLYG